MKFDTLKAECEYFRGLEDDRLIPDSYVLAMVDGKNFSRMIKKRFKLPFDDAFIDIMNKTAAFVCHNIQGCKFAFTQSDEISFVITDFDTPITDSYYGYRKSKLLSIIASLATSEFNKLLILELLKTPCSPKDMYEIIKSTNFVQFDCKVWNVPSFNKVYKWFRYRQLDCVRNSKQQTAQTYLPHDTLRKHNTDEQIEMLKKFNGIDWNSFDNGKKYGRFIFKEKEINSVMINGEVKEFEREAFEAHEGFPIYAENGYEEFSKICVLPRLE